MCCSLSDPKGLARLSARIGFGLALAFAGIAHYQDASYAEAVGRGLGVLEPVGMVWGYILPGLMIVGGLLLTFGIYLNIAAITAGIALASIPAGLMLKSAISGIPVEDTMPFAVNALVWLLVFILVCKNCCGCSGGACHCAGGSCNCADTPAAKPVLKTTPAPMKSVAPAPVAKAAPVMPKKVVPAVKPKAKVPVKKPGSKA